MTANGPYDASGDAVFFRPEAPAMGGHVLTVAHHIDGRDGRTGAQQVAHLLNLGEAADFLLRASTRCSWVTHHTPGPWVDHLDRVETADKERADICNVNPEHFGQGDRPRPYMERRANSKLIAAAARMLEGYRSLAPLDGPGLDELDTETLRETIRYVAATARDQVDAAVHRPSATEQDRHKVDVAYIASRRERR